LITTMPSAKNKKSGSVRLNPVCEPRYKYAEAVGL
jgi:hypothetical protein